MGERTSIFSCLDSVGRFFFFYFVCWFLWVYRYESTASRVIFQTVWVCDWVESRVPDLRGRGLVRNTESDILDLMVVSF